ncbi:hypothetical protein [Bittarella sp. HCP28S3_D9]|uniref:hypothetical protein n=1 Tax=Bittarella sp. HCP28S3_D9 TaxID=3440253 RepID=UPI003F8C914B
MKSLYKNQLTAFFRFPLMWVGLAAILVFPHAILSPRIAFLLEDLTLTGDVLQYAATVFRQTPTICFLFMAFLSYEFFVRNKSRDLLETFRAMPGGTLRVLGSQALVLLGVLALSVINVGGYIFYGIYLVGGVDLAIFGNIVAAILLYLLLPGLLAIALGIALALYVGRVPAYAVITLWGYLASELLYKPLFMAQATMGPIGYWLRDVIAVSDVGESLSNGIYGLPVEWYRIARWGFWFFLLLGLGYLGTAGVATRKKRWVKRGCLILSVLCLVAFLGKQGYVPQDGRIDGRSTYSYYYFNRGKEEKAAFSISDYDLDLHVGDGMRMTASLGLADAEKEEELKFTLYHSYRVKKVQAEDGTPLPFAQDGDYLTVDKSKAMDTERIALQYSGNAGPFYTNNQGIYLPGDVPYYPVEGFRLLSIQPDEKMNAGDFIYAPLLNEEKPFTVRLAYGKHPLYLSLPQVEEGVYSGLCNGPTIMAGFLEETEEEGVSIVRPLYHHGLASFSEEDAAAVEKLDAALGTDLAGYLERTPLFCVDTSQFGNALGHSSYVQMSDHVLVRNRLGGNVFRFVPMLAGDNAEKQTVATAISYLFDPSMRQIFISEFGGGNGMGMAWRFMGEDEEAYRLFIRASEQLGEDALCRAAGQYITNPKDSRSAQVFLQDLLEGE